MKTKEAQALETPQTQIAKIIPIRTETILCQYPIHKLSNNKKPVQITLTTENERGKVETTWKVSPNAEYGQPGILAYKLDTLFINRLIDELHPNVPEVIKIGDSLNEIGKQLGREGTRNTAEIVKALHQNASAYIKAKLEYSGKGGTHRKFEFGSTRYAVVMIGESLPDGTKAEAVYIVLNPLFRDVLQNAKRRPLDYDYLKSLPPTAQRWYELVSFQVFAALNLGNPRARYLYSEFCRRAPLTRFFNWEQAKKQLYKIHRSHIESGYISKVEAEETTDEKGRPDWFLWYTPGRKAKREYREFNERPQKAQTPQSPPRPQLVRAEEKSREENAPERTPQDSALIEKLMSFGVDEGRAARLVASDRAECGLWAAAWPHQNQKGMENPPAVLIRFIETKRRPLPKGYKDAIEKERKAKEAERKKAIEEAQNAHFARCVGTYWRDYLMSELEALKESNAEAFDELQKRLSMWDEYTERHDIALMRTITTEDFIAENQWLGILSFWQWDEEKNPHPFKLAD
jgi:hypothetical protein